MVKRLFDGLYLEPPEPHLSYQLAMEPLENVTLWPGHHSSMSSAYNFAVQYNKTTAVQALNDLFAETDKLYSFSLIISFLP